MVPSGGDSGQNLESLFEIKMNKPIVKLVGADGNAFHILGLCRQAALKAKWPPEKIDAVMKDMRSGDYNHLLAVALDNFDVR